MANIKFRVDGLTETTLTYNPYSISIPQSVKSGLIKQQITIDGESISFEKSFDSRRGKLVWQGFPSSHSAFADQLDFLESIVGKRVEMSFGNDVGDIGYALGVYTTWTIIKAISLDRVIRDGGRIIFNSITFVFENAESL